MGEQTLIIFRLGVQMIRSGFWKAHDPNVPSQDPPALLNAECQAGSNSDPGRISAISMMLAVGGVLFATPPTQAPSQTPTVSIYRAVTII